jgi:lipoyl(octanoyl) transferase
MTESTDYPRADWRLLYTGARSGAENMAIDEAILEATTAGRVLPTLRFYRWSPPCLSLGYSQPAVDVDRPRCAERGWDLVRRPTGGKAILHTDELTYSVCAPLGEPRVAGGIVESYGRLVAGLMAGLQLAHLAPAEARPAYGEAQAAVGPVCFDGPAKYEVTVDLKKLIGSAQSRRLGGVLQHGTLPLTGDITRIVEVLAYPDEAAREQARQRLLGRALTLEDALGRNASFDEVAQLMAQGFAQALNLNLIPAELTAGEIEAATRIRREKYANETWTTKS